MPPAAVSEIRKRSCKSEGTNARAPKTIAPSSATVTSTVRAQRSRRIARTCVQKGNRRGMATAVAIPLRLPFWTQVRAILRDRWARAVLVTVALEGAIVFGALAFVPSDLHDRFRISLTAAGGIVAAYGLGGVAYTLCARRLVARLGERGLAQ